MIKLKAKTDKINLIIEEDKPEVGFYLYVYDNSGNCIHDYLQNTLEDAKKQAKEDFNIDEEN